MSDFKERLEAEKADLEERLNKLNAFNASEKSKEIDQVQRSISIIQAGAMYTYLECLKEALARL
jgi:TPP-dependent indolepyruvate ferredoxin oxidoreductase alpha subunit